MDSFNVVTNPKETPGNMQPSTIAIDPGLKLAAERVFERLGLTPSEAIRLFYKQVELHQGLPFEIKIPHETSASMLPAQLSPASRSEEAESPESADDLKSYGNIDQLLDSL